MKEGASRSDDLQEFVALYAPLETYAVGDTPPSRCTRNPLPFRTISEDSQHRIRMTNVTDRSDGQPTAFPRQKPRRENNVGSSWSRGLDIPDVDRCRIRQHAQCSPCPYESRCIGILSEDDDSSLLCAACGPNPHQQSTGGHTARLVDQALPAKIRYQG